MNHTVKRHVPMLIGIALLVVCSVSCKSSPEALIPLDYVKWVEQPDNGLRVSEEIEGFRFTLQYQPLDYMIAKQEKTPELSDQTLKEKRSALEDLQYFLLRIGSADDKTDVLKLNISETNEYYTRIAYFNGGIQDDLQLVDGSDTLRCVLHHFERTYKMAPFNNIVLAFKKPNPKNRQQQINDKVFIMNDRVLGVGQVIMKINQDDLKKIPAIKTHS